MDAQNPHSLARKPVQSTSSRSHGAVDDHSPTGRGVFEQNNEEQATQRRPLNTHIKHPLDQEGHLLAVQHNGGGATADDEKPQRPRDASKAHDLRRSYNRLSYRTWFWESLSCVAAALLLCAIVIVLAIYNGRPLPQLPFSISLNTVVSLLATALKAALIIPVAACISQLKWYWYRQTRALSDIATYDEASRGPYGAFVLLCSPQLRGLATVGAMITILAVAIDPFTQQIIRYRHCASSHSNATAAVVRAQNYSIAGGLFTTGSEGYMQAMDLNMQSAIFQGAYGSPSNAVNLLTRCETGNCSFPHDNGIAYQSLGICHKCANVSSSILTFCQNGSLPDNIDFQECNYTLPLQPNATSYYLRESNETSVWWPATSMNDSTQLGPSIPLGQYWQHALLLDMQPQYTNEQLYGEPSEPIQYDPKGNPGIVLVDNNSVGKFAYIAESYLWNDTAEFRAEADGDPVNNYPVAVECGLYPCIQSYGASVDNGLLHEEMVHQQYLHWPNLPAVDLDAVASPCIVNGNDIDASDINVSWNISYEDPIGVLGGVPDITGLTSTNRQCLYHLDMSSISAMTIFFAMMMKGDHYAQTFDVVDNVGQTWRDILYKAGNNNLTTTNTTMSNIAASMTNNMRLKASNSKPVLGQVWWSETCVEVQWAWLTLHAVLVSFCILFLVLTMLLSSKYARGQLWKSSALALMFHGLNDATAEKVGMIDAVDEMEDRAGRLQVHTAYTDQGWRFIESVG